MYFNIYIYLYVYIKTYMCVYIYILFKNRLFKWARVLLKSKADGVGDYFGLGPIYMIFKKLFFVSLLVCMLCQSKFLIIPNSQGPEALN